jgi:hypothetical protein
MSREELPAGALARYEESDPKTRTVLPLKAGERFAVLSWDWKAQRPSYQNRRCNDLGLLYAHEVETWSDSYGEIRAARQLEPEEAQILWDIHHEGEGLIPIQDPKLQYLFEVEASEVEER